MEPPCKFAENICGHSQDAYRSLRAHNPMPTLNERMVPVDPPGIRVPTRVQGDVYAPHSSTSMKGSVNHRTASCSIHRRWTSVEGILHMVDCHDSSPVAQPDGGEQSGAPGSPLPTVKGWMPCGGCVMCEWVEGRPHFANVSRGPMKLAQGVFTLKIFHTGSEK
jgi:hypothetical protein